MTDAEVISELQAGTMLLKRQRYELLGKIDTLKAKTDKLAEALKNNALLSGKGLSALESMATVDFMVKACCGSLTPTDVAESINGIILDAKTKAEQLLKEIE